MIIKNKTAKYNVVEKNKRIRGKPAVTPKSIIISLARWIFLIAFSYILIYPLLFMLSSSVKSAVDFQDPTVIWVAKHFSLDYFIAAFKVLNFGSSLKNTLLFEVVSALLEIFTCAVAAYGFSRFEFPEKKVLSVLLILTILMPVQMVTLPNVLNFQKLDFLGILGQIEKWTGASLRPNILDSPLTFYLPSLTATGLRGGLMIFIYSQFFKGLPKELEEAAWIDGANPIMTFLRIIIPSSGVVIFTVTIFSMIWHWNDYYLAIMYTTKNHPLSVALSNIYQAMESHGYNKFDQSSTAIVMSGCLIFILPMIVMYLLLQRKFIESIDRVGIVG